MKVLSVLFLIFVFCGLFTPTPTSAQIASQYYLAIVEGNQVCFYLVTKTEEGGIRVDEKKCVSIEELLDDQDGDTISSSIVCEYLEDEITNDSDLECHVIIGTSKSVNGTTQRSVSVASFDGTQISNAQTFPNFSPGNFFGAGVTDVSASPASAQGNKGAAVANRLFIAGSQGTTGANDFFSFALNSDKLPTGTKSTLFSNPNNKFALGGSISRDGRIAVQLSAASTLWQLSTRLLNNGVPRKAPSSWTVPAYHGYSPDITNAIEVNSGLAAASALKIRYLVYRAFKGVGTTGQQSQIMIVKIDDATGKPLEAARPLTPFKNAFLAPAEAFQSIAIAPNGELMFFTEYSGACKKMILKAVKLVNGAVSGPAKTIAGCASLKDSPFGYTGLDITENPEPDNP